MTAYRAANRHDMGHAQLKVLLLQLDGKLPNLALMRIAAHHRALGDEVELRRIVNPRGIEAGLWDDFDRVYASLIFTRSRPLALRLGEVYPGARIGGTGWNNTGNLAENGIETLQTDYSDYPECDYSMGFVFRGCRLACEFCVVPEKEGRVKPEQTIAEIWRGDPARKLLLLDNDFGGHPTWKDRAREIIDGGFRVSFSQGINARLLNEDLAGALGSMKCMDDGFKHRCIYTAWDNRRDEKILFRGLQWLVDAGFRPDSIMVYMLCGFWPGETHEDRDYRRRRLREFGARPYPMPYVRTPELVGFQRWVVRREDVGKHAVSWKDFMGANYRPEKVRRDAPVFPMFDGAPGA